MRAHPGGPSWLGDHAPQPCNMVFAIATGEAREKERKKRETERDIERRRHTVIGAMVLEHAFCRRDYDFVKGLRMGNGFLDKAIGRESGE